MLGNLHVSDFMSWARDIAVSRQVLQSLALQLALTGAVVALAWGIRAATRASVDRLIERLVPSEWVRIELRRLAIFGVAWLLLVIVESAGAGLGLKVGLIGIAATLSALWIVLRASSLLFRDAL
ncbi:MAG TPA: hypothetical protein VND95_01085, partial [Stellaceae bacterium]|nr:hypothetical protein [Stellaceae bacterium]